MKIVSLTGAGSGVTYTAEKLAENSDVAYLKPYTDKETLSSAESIVGYHQVSKEELDLMIQTEDVLCITKVNNHRWVYFKSQLEEAYNILITDDYSVVDLWDRWDGELYNIKVVTPENLKSNRIDVYLYDHEFDEVFDYKTDDFDELGARIV